MRGWSGLTRTRCGCPPSDRRAPSRLFKTPAGEFDPEVRHYEGCAACGRLWCTTLCDGTKMPSPSNLAITGPPCRSSLSPTAPPRLAAPAINTPASSAAAIRPVQRCAPAASPLSLPLRCELHIKRQSPPSGSNHLGRTALPPTAGTHRCTPTNVPRTALFRAPCHREGPSRRQQCPADPVLVSAPLSGTWRTGASAIAFWHITIGAGMSTGLVLRLSKALIGANASVARGSCNPRGQCS